jgi:hypothetical protein
VFKSFPQLQFHAIAVRFSGSGFDGSGSCNLVSVRSTTACVVLLLLLPFCIQPQERKLECKKSALSALKRLPKLRYRCGAQSDEWDEKILKRPDRLRALAVVSNKLERLTDPAWWQSSVADLSFCDLRRTAGILTADERQKITGGDYTILLRGDNRIRLVITYDPCYQTEYNGSIAFLLYRKRGKVNVTRVLDGYFSRADNSINLGVATLNGEDLVEVSTGTGGLQPEVTNYYFVIDRKTNHAVPRNLFQTDKRLTNTISSAILMDPSGDFDPTKDVEELIVIRDHKLVKEFSIYTGDPDGKIEDNGRKLARSILRWNGRFFQ